MIGAVADLVDLKAAFYAVSFLMGLSAVIVMALLTETLPRRSQAG